MIRIGVVGLGKMGLSHMSMIRPHPDVEVVALCDSTRYLLDVLEKYTGVPAYHDYDEMLATAGLDAVIIATPTHAHAPMVRKAIDRGLHVFCEKPFVLDPEEGETLATAAATRGLVTQVGYHNRFVGSFREVKRLLEAGAIGEVVGGLAEAYGPVVLKPAGRTWRSKASMGGGCLYDYAAHPLDLVGWYLGAPQEVRGQLVGVFSRKLDDIVTATLNYPKASVLLNVNWSDESERKMTTQITLWGTRGRIYADRQEIQVYLRDVPGASIPAGYRPGWNVWYTTELMAAPYFYVRGEEYSAQLDAFVQRIHTRSTSGENDFLSAIQTDRTIAKIREDGERDLADAPAEPSAAAEVSATTTTPWLDRTERGIERALHAAERATSSGIDALRARRNR